jgi:hypothetical protein
MVFGLLLILVMLPLSLYCAYVLSLDRLKSQAGDKNEEEGSLDDREYA